VIKRDGFWGQGESILPDLECPAPAAGSSRGNGSGSAAEGTAVPAAAGSVMPLGQLEFILDRRRREQQQRQR